MLLKIKNAPLYQQNAINSASKTNLCTNFHNFGESTLYSEFDKISKSSYPLRRMLYELGSGDDERNDDKVIREESRDENDGRKRLRIRWMPLQPLKSKLRMSTLKTS